MKKFAVFCDFDGTITEKDNILSIMQKFAPLEWIKVKDQILAQEISIQEGVGRMFSLLRSGLKDEIVHFAVQNASIRPGFQELIDFLNEHDIPLFIVSGGIDFFVEPILEKFSPFAGLYCNGADFSGENIKILWPHSCDDYCSNGCGCCKPSVMRKLEGKGFYKIVIGDSITDLEAAKQADFVLARDFLKDKCKELGIAFESFETFFDCIKSIQKMIEVKV
ncbi:2-hydroxy-3-keto-5-methylthiopentenyl-1-phosphate phosphatase [Bacillus methanolicus]|uniref:2-hydroxy-3-keto-5-methylthiopentenyl-1-phosphate phosphatase n=1 Tax=Bacillus methanolicus (strain MGA3 / ATCC 53907) TaxID=796606 RepID=I3E805_BACMM|nr:2-hydroxy-3-keto-5-methylthiopentenyl-1-phosphate phosphatase [Bacillus methanolicus]AIE59442.1 2-hydroxy-3-keto-5-methylthiopentenyl-1-phosphate phosphatase [Bacillus methanolicus MGA3]EIJ82626.1 2-hydroxy-3-keto-5-methylthiopentenyl-1-phosphate phosphatase [Bacillus methanolicus MGA3]UQD51510.1 2-hydroxy-3-keto-5-methylthiopentenyl-1-phosphate phosphatase [Bacillus methanolicus]